MNIKDMIKDRAVLWLISRARWERPYHKHDDDEGRRFLIAQHKIMKIKLRGVVENSWSI